MIKVMFKEDFKNEFSGNEYTYKSNIDVKIGDIVAVNTKYGYEIAKVTQTDIIDTNFIDEQLKEVKVVVLSVEEQRQEQEKKQKYNELVAKIRKDKLVAEIADLVTDVELAMVKEMTYEELKKFYDAIK